MMGKDSLVYSTEHAVSRKDAHSDPLPKAAQGKSPASEQVRVSLDKKGRGGKAVSVVSGLRLSGAELETMLKQFKTRLGTGGTIKDGTIEIQGDHVSTVLSLLQERGYRPKRSGG